MKKQRLFLLLSCLCIAMFSSCLKDNCESERTYVRWDPVFKTLEDLRTDISIESARQLENPGNIYYYNGFLLINEILEGVHVIDNRDPENPQNVSFIDIPGSRDMAVKDGSLPLDILEVDNSAVRLSQIERLNKLKSERNNDTVKVALDALARCAESGEGNLLELSIEAAKARATLGEISGAIESIFKAKSRYSSLVKFERYSSSFSASSGGSTKTGSCTLSISSSILATAS